MHLRYWLCSPHPSTIYIAENNNKQFREGRIPGPELKVYNSAWQRSACFGTELTRIKEEG